MLNNKESQLLIFTLSIYFFVMLLNPTVFPIYFFCDEAYFQVMAERLLNGDIEKYSNYYLPMFFEKATYRWVPQIGIYFYLLPTLFFGKSESVTRITSVILSSPLPIMAALCFRKAYKLGYSWLYPLILSAIPYWVLNGRLGFETSHAFAFFMAGVAAYILSVTTNKRYRLLATVLFIISAYFHLSGVIMSGIFLVLVAIADIKVHLSNRRLSFACCLILALASLPALEFLIRNPSANSTQLNVIYSPLSVPGFGAKLAALYNSALNALNFSSLFSMTTFSQEIRHAWMNRPPMPLWSIPFAIIGALSCIVRFNRSEYRSLLFALLASSVPPIIAGVTLLRLGGSIVVISFLCGLGLLQTLALCRRIPLLRTIAPATASIGLVAAPLVLLKEAMVEAPTWYDNYGLYGMQYGAHDYFTLLRREIVKHPGETIYGSGLWTNGIDRLTSFYLDDEQEAHYKIVKAREFLDDIGEAGKSYVLLLDKDEYNNLKAEEQYIDKMEVAQTISYPNSEPGFFLVNLQLGSKMSEYHRKRDTERRQLRYFRIPQKNLEVGAPELTLGNLAALFDGNPDTLIRTDKFTPLKVHIRLDIPQSISKIKFKMSKQHGTAQLSVADSAGQFSPLITKEVPNPSGQDVEIEFSELPSMPIKELLFSFEEKQDPNLVTHMGEITITYGTENS